jgi:hypothetical protein
MKNIYITIPEQEKTNFIEHGKTNLIDLVNTDLNTTGTIRFIKSLNSNIIAEFRLNMNGVQEVYNFYSTFGIGMLFNQPDEIKIEILQDYVIVTVPDNIYNNIIGA